MKRLAKHIKVGVSVILEASNNSAAEMIIQTRDKAAVKQ